MTPSYQPDNIKRVRLTWRSIFSMSSARCHWSINILLIILDIFLLDGYWRMKPSHEIMVLFAFFCWHLSVNLEMLFSKGAAQ